MMLVRQNFPDRSLSDVPGEVAKQMAASGFASRLKPGASVAIGVGSRGIRNVATIARGVVGYWKDHGMRPFLFPAMGSHGAATPEGQARVLAHYGITEAAMGCPIRSQLEVVSLGKTDDGIEAFMDRLAYEADGVMMVARIKWHTDFEGKLESGLFKMMAIGLGKFAGAQRYHTYAYRMGLDRVVLTVGRQVLRSGKILGGLGILEDANHGTARLEAIPAQSMEEREAEALALVKSWRARIPVDLDLLVIDEIGKEISGSGMDSKIVNRGHQGERNRWPGAPHIERIFVRDLSALTYNNAIGIGNADVTTDRLVNRIDWEPTLINGLTSSTPASARVPPHFATDRECLDRIMRTVGRIDLEDVTYGWIHNSLELSRIALSENLRSEVEKNPALEIESRFDMAFDDSQNLISPFVPVEEAAGVH
jgi:hypothetical protein